MANLLLEGFDHHASTQLNDDWDFTERTASYAPVFVTGRYGNGQATEQNTVNDDIFTPTNSIAEGWFGAAYRLLERDDELEEDLLRFLYNGTQSAHVVLSRVSAGAIQLTNGSGTVLDYSRPRVLLNRIWHYIEVRLLSADSGGRCEVWVDGVREIDFTGDTANNAVTNWDRVEVCGSQDNDQWDCLYINDVSGSAPWNGRVGEVEIITLRPDGDGFQTDYTATGTGTTNADRVDDSPGPDDNSTYVESSTVGHIDSYTFENIGAYDNYYAVQCKALVSDGGGSSTNFRQRLRSSATDSLGTTVGSAASFTGDRHYVYTDPNTAAAWTQSGVNAMEIGHEVMA